MRLKPIASVAILIAVIAAPVASAEPAEPSEWHYVAVLYGWMTGLEGTIGFGDQLQEPVEATFGDLLSYVNFSMAGHFEAKNRSAVLITDVFYANLGSSSEGQVGNQPVTVDLDLTQWIIELGGGYRVTQEFDVLLAGRYYFLDTGATLTSVAGSQTGDVEQSWGDLYIGARYSRLLREKWIVSIRGDIGAGGSEFAWFGNVAFGYRFTDLLSAAIAWRVLSLDREPDPDDGNYFKYDVVQNGFGIGLGFSF